ncbi:TRPL translocation defect protein 14 [Porphyridium purpureum]|uniref:TRPL translocation defect protein 14 n=1 Tax=Porphyridium purpureum TaxID=35688 RepID=A0A5J4YKB5_PORPP|nr:TRPL translocation defect protein 14 [Porphyridium purpureum]|eukprot:POR0341..scf244_11
MDTADPVEVGRSDGSETQQSASPGPSSAPISVPKKPSELTEQPAISSLTQHFKGVWQSVLDGSDEAEDSEQCGEAAEIALRQSEKLKDGTPVFRIVMTGGPCAGKSTGMAVVAERLRSRGFEVYMVAEAATLLFTGGANFRLLNTELKVIEFQASLLKTQMTLEDAFVNVARVSQRPSVILCDRGTMDGAAYMSPSMWDTMLKMNGWTQANLRDDRYEAVIHLVTAADGKPEFYSLLNNMTRTEPPEEAIALDTKLRRCWVGHRRQYVVDNSTGFEEKINRAYKFVAEAVGLPTPGSQTLRKKYLVRLVDRQALEELEEVQFFEVVQTVLMRKSAHEGITNEIEANVEEWVRRRSADGVHHYSHTVRRPGPGGTRVELKRQLTHREYNTLLAFEDSSSKPLTLERCCFVVGKQVFVMDTLQDSGIILLRTQLDREGAEGLRGESLLWIPPFVQVESEVTGDTSFSIAALAKCEKQDKSVETSVS